MHNSNDPADAVKKITEIWAWVCTEAHGGEGIPAINSGLGPLPMIGADEKRIRSLEPHARVVAEQMGLPVKLMRFTNAEVIETL